MSDAEGRWLDKTERWSHILDYGRLPRPWRRLAIVLFPITLPVWFLWTLGCIVIFVVGCAYVCAADSWNAK